MVFMGFLKLFFMENISRRVYDGHGLIMLKF